jgi:thiol-disulfide isomerase/thioredoxin
LPDATLQSADGGESLELGQLRGPVLVNLWATWCIPCRAELPALQAVADDATTGVAVIGINVGDDAASIAEYLDELSVTFPNYVDPNGVVQTEFAIAGLPATIAVNADGEAVEVHQGTLDEDGFRDLADQALTDSTNS